MPDQTAARDYDTGRCSGCGGVYTLTKAGKVRHHNRDYDPCPGGGRSPVE